MTPGEERQFVRRLADDDRWSTGEPHDLLAAGFDVTYSDRHLHRKLEDCGLAKVPLTDTFRWPAEAPHEPVERRTAALEQAGLLAMGANGTSEQSR